VFVTTAHGRSTYWVVAARDSDRVRYARTTPAFTAGTVEVRRRHSDARSTHVDVTYDISALTPQGAVELDAFAARYERDIRAWGGAHRDRTRERDPSVTNGLSWSLGGQPHAVARISPLGGRVRSRKGCWTR
jgi:hypothetical protein